MAKQFDWGAMEWFLAIARSGRLTVAAQKLGIDHTTLSRRIKQLEETLDTRLFERSVTGYTLTPQGERFLEAAQGAETIALQAANDISGETSKIAGTIRIGGPEGFGSSFMAPSLVKLGQKQPGLKLELVTMPRRFSLTKREADMAVSLARPEKGRFHAHKLTDYELGLYGTAEYFDRFGQPETRADLRDHRIIGYVQDLIYARELDYIPQISKDIVPWITSSNLLAQMNMTIAGAGLCILPKFIAATDPRLIRTMAGEVRLIRSFWLIVHADLRDLARIRYCSDFLTQEVRAARALFLS
ncbi:LysR family transcriptional regulator [Sinisalibacter aestuarii]|uniref:Transcriptional regulator n=1 Tax=Sinisalibacter aestuarii TaxID=2949426 RepID=A0ABQ5LYB3_9RHOB|nr:LysR family transcriptional regulator [Sinisalibacter aestuarii]GKY89628.1 transcriptional regulator [Sinisalibacter aestuarii]